MAPSERVLTLKITGDASGLGRAFGQVDRGASRMDRGMDRARRGMVNMGKAAGIAAAAVATAGAAFAKLGLDGAISQERLNARTQNVLRTMGQGAGRTAEQIEGLATQIERATGSDGQVVQAGANLVLTFGNIKNAAGAGNDVFDRTVKLANDMSVALGQDMSASSIQLGKALNDPVKGVTALTRVGVSFTAQQKEQITALTESGDALGAQRLILSEVEKQFGGAAAAEGPLTEAMQSLTNTFGEVSEAIMVKALPALTSAVEVIRANVVPVIQDMAERVAPLIGQAMEWIGQKVGEAADWIRRNWDQISATATRVWAQVSDVIRSAVRSAQPVIEEFGRTVRAVLDAVATFWNKWGDEIAAVVKWAFDQVMQILRPALATIRSVFETFTALMEGDWGGVWKGLKDIVRNALKTLWAYLTSELLIGVSIIRGFGIKIVKGMKDGMLGLAKTMREGVTSGFRGLVQLGPKLIDEGARVAKSFISGIVNYITRELPAQLARAVSSAVSNIFRGGATAAAPIGSVPNLGRFAGGANGMMLPGTYQGVDTMLAAVAPGEAILTPRQQSLVESGVPIRRALAMTGGAFSAGGYVSPVPGGNWKYGPGAGTHSRSERGYVWQDDDAWDIKAPHGAPVLAGFSGVIGRVSPFNSDPRFWGHGLYLSGPPGQLFYKHLRTVNVRSGQAVTAGTVLGTLGDGVNGGSHLHLGAAPIGLLESLRAGGVAPDAEDGHDHQDEGSAPGERSAPPALTDRQKLAQLLGKATGRAGLGTGAGKPVSAWARPLVNTLTSDVPDVSGSTTGTSFTGAQGRSISGAARRARTKARASGKSPEEVREAGEAAEREAELKVLRINRRDAIQKRAALRRAKGRLLARWRKLTRKPAKTPKARAARKKATREINAKLREFTAEINDLTEIIAEIAERMREIGEEVIEAAHEANYEAGEEAARAAEEAARGGESGEATGSVGAGPEAPTTEPATPLDFLNLAATLASTTEGTDDDLAVLSALLQYRQGELAQAIPTGDPRLINAALQNLLSVQQQIRALMDNTEALTENTQAMQGLTGSVTFGFRGQDYVLRNLAPPSSDRIENILVGA